MSTKTQTIQPKAAVQAAKWGLAGALLSVASTVSALPVDATINENRNDGYSVVHSGSNPGGTGNSNDWLWFNPGQSLALDVTNGLVSLLGAQSFDLTSNNGATASILITDLQIDLNDANDGFAGGYLDYALNGITGSFSFADANHNAIYNSGSFDGSSLAFYAWGGDQNNALGLDLGVTGLVVEPDPDPVPVPGTLALALAGLAGVWRSRRKQA